MRPTVVTTWRDDRMRHIWSMTDDTNKPAPSNSTERTAQPTGRPAETADKTDVPEIGGPSGPEPTRYGDRERGGRCSDF